jgi:hypothetical protein
MYEHRTAPILTRHGFARRMLRHFLLAQVVVLGSLLLGVIGYRVLAGFTWIDSLLNAAMLLGGMGPVGDIPSTGGKLFASFYALFAGLVLITVSGILLAPILHRVLHRFHLEGKQ